MELSDDVESTDIGMCSNHVAEFYYTIVNMHLMFNCYFVVCEGEKKGKLLVLFPTMYLSGGTCVTLIMIGGETMKILFYQIACRTQSCNVNPLTTVEWYLVFTCSAVVLAQLPNLNSIAGVSLIGAITAIAYCTIIWVVSVVKGRPMGISYGPPPLEVNSDVSRLCTALNGLGIIAFAFRGHNLVLEIQVGALMSNIIYFVTGLGNRISGSWPPE